MMSLSDDERKVMVPKACKTRKFGILDDTATLDDVLSDS